MHPVDDKPQEGCERAGVMDAVRLRFSKLTLAAGERLRQVLPSPFQVCRVAVRREVDTC